MGIKIDTNSILLEAVRYSKRARPEFFLKKQAESGWSKGVFFSELVNSYDYWEKYLIAHDIKRRETSEAVSIPFINPLPGGPKALTIDLLLELREAIDAAINSDKANPEYSPLRIIAMVDAGLRFINSHFLYQSNKKKWPIFVIRFPKDFKNGDYLFNTYCIAGEQIFFNFKRFRDEVRGLYLTTTNIDGFKRMLLPTLDLALRNINLWNEQIWPIVKDLRSEKPEREIKHGQQLLEIDPETFNINYSPSDPSKFKKGFYKFYQNHDFAIFSESVANFLEYHIFNRDGEKQEVKGAIEIVPVFKKDYINAIFNELKDFFNIEHQEELKKILQNGGHAIEKLTFKSSGNRLADAFKQLFDAQIIVGCEKKYLINWIIANFQFSSNGNIVDYKYKTLEAIISSNDDKCKKPIINVKIDKTTGQYQITKA